MTVGATTRASRLRRIGIGAAIWLILGAIGFTAAVWGAWLHASATYPMDTYPDERLLRATWAWPTIAGVSIVVAAPIALIGVLLPRRIGLVFVVLLAVGLVLLGLAGGGIFINVGEPGPGSPSNV